MKKLGMLLMFAVALIACKSSKKSGEEKVAVIQQDSTSLESLSRDTIQDIFVNSAFVKSDSLMSSLKINGARINGDVLAIDVQYSGGCEEHEFDMYFTGNYMKSLPPQVQLFLVHENNGDMCRKLIMKTLYFSLKNIQTKEKELYVRIDGYKEFLIYKY